MVDWLRDLVERGSGWNDAVLLAEAWRVASAGGDCADVAELAEALAGSKERHMETTLQGRAFAEAVGAWGGADGVRTRAPTPLCPAGHLPSRGERIGSVDDWRNPGGRLISPLEGVGRTEGGRRREEPVDAGSEPYPVAVGITAARHGIPLGDTLAAFLHAFTSNLIQAAVRLVPLGQRDGVAAIAALEPVVLATAARAENSTLDDLGSCAVMSEIMSMKHEALYSRVFRS